MDLGSFNTGDFRRGASSLKEALWQVVEALFFSSFLPGSAWRRAVLRVFGAEIGAAVVIKPRVRVKFPWRLKIGDRSWIGESVWIDNLAKVDIGSDVCISQGAYLCTGSHNWSKTGFDLIVAPISIRSKAWVCAMARVSPGCVIEEGAILGLGAVATKRLNAWSIYQGNPALLKSLRKFEV